MAGPWVAPDTPSAPPTAPVAPSPTAPTGPRAAAEAGADQPPPVPVPLRPFTIPDVLDGALRAWKLAPGTMAGLTATFVVPTQLLLGWLSRDRTEDLRLSETFRQALTASGPGDLDTGFGTDDFLLGLGIQGLALAFVAAGVARVVTGWYAGRRDAYGDAVRATLRRAVPLVVAWALVHLIEGVAALPLLVPVLVPLALLSVVTPLVAVEQAGPLRAVRRSVRLTRRRLGTVLAVCLLVALTDVVLSSALTALGALYLELDLPAGWAVNTVVTTAALLVTMPFVAAAATLLYLDLRVRAEGLDIELAAGRRFG